MPLPAGAKIGWVIVMASVLGFDKKYPEMMRQMREAPKSQKRLEKELAQGGSFDRLCLFRAPGSVSWLGKTAEKAGLKTGDIIRLDIENLRYMDRAKATLAGVIANARTGEPVPNAVVRLVPAGVGSTIAANSPYTSNGPAIGASSRHPGDLSGLPPGPPWKRVRSMCGAWMP